jgi:hypothetical protein
MVNGTNLTFFTVEPPSLESRILFGLFFLVLILIGLVANVFLLYVLWKHHQHFVHSFYILTYHLLTADVVFLIANILFSVPATFLGKSPFFDTFEITFGFLSTVFFLTLLFASLIISISRLLIFFAPSYNTVLFERPNVCIVAFFPWFIGIFIAALTSLLNCPKRFNYNLFYFAYACPTPGKNPLVDVIMSIVSYFVRLTYRSLCIRQVSKIIKSVQPITIGEGNIHPLSGFLGYLLDAWSLPYAINCLRRSFIVPQQSKASS